MTPAIHWRAVNRKGIAHAFATQRGPALCGIANQDQRFDWPRKSHCPRCMELLAASIDTAGAL